MTIVGSGFWVGADKENKYEIPDMKQLEKLFNGEIKPKLWFFNLFILYLTIITLH